MWWWSVLLAENVILKRGAELHMTQSVGGMDARMPTPVRQGGREMLSARDSVLVQKVNYCTVRRIKVHFFSTFE